jgi:S1-C subfamily serine protease
MGISVTIYPDAQNIGFAVPVKRARDLLARWLAPRLLKKLWLGFEPVEEGNRLVVGAIESDSPAALAGLQETDTILSVDGKPVNRLFDFYRHLLTFSPEQPFYLEIRRSEEEVQNVRLALSDLPKPSGQRLARALLGLEFEETEPGRRRYLKGLLIEHIQPDSPAEVAGLVPGLYLTRINDVEISTLDDVGLALENIRPRDTLQIVVVSVSESGRFLVAQSAVVKLQARKGA